MQEVVQRHESTHDESVGVDRAEPTIHCETQPDASGVTSNAVNIVVNGDHEKEKTAVEDFPVVDTNNTNVHYEATLKMEEPEVKTPAFDDVMTTKLAGLELTNGHSHTEDVTTTTPSEMFSRFSLPVAATQPPNYFQSLRCGFLSRGLMEALVETSVHFPSPHDTPAICKSSFFCHNPTGLTVFPK
ncbi:hypothetical protein AHF37_03215 [Paragonimus kellicotti]|nr:hypothetical protein AHF37_03215 [Paragonimus kellicotti]